MHTEYYNSNNTEVPSVTTILKILDKAGLVEWSNMLGKRGLDYRTTLEQYAIRGTKIHNDIESILENGYPVPRLFNTNEDDEIGLVVNKFKSSLDELQITNTITEKSYSCDKYGGTFDIVCDINLDGELTTILGDFKTSKKIYTSQFIQLGGYLNLILLNDPELYDRIKYCGIINIKKDAVTIQYIDKEEFANTFIKLFNSIVDVYYQLQAIETIKFNIKKY